MIQHYGKVKHNTYIHPCIHPRYLFLHTYRGNNKGRVVQVPQSTGREARKGREGREGHPDDIGGFIIWYLRNKNKNTLLCFNLYGDCSYDTVPFK